MKIFVLICLFSVSVIFAQEYPFLPSSAREAKKSEFVSYLNTIPLTKHDSVISSIKYLKENGTYYNRSYTDSITKTEEGYLYATKQYRDTLTNQYYYVLYKRTKEQAKADNKIMNDKIEADQKNRKALKGSVIDELTMTDMNGNSYTAQSLRGKVLVIDFWFVTCSACIKEMPDLNELKEKFGTDEVAYFGITFDEKEKVEKFLKKVEYNFTIIPDGRYLTDQFNIKFYPTTLVVDKEGKIIYTGDFFDFKDKMKKISKLIKKNVSR